MQYISPEAIEGEVVDNRSDIYSLGCTAFHLFTGQPPFAGATIASTMSAHLTKPVPSISRVNQHLPDKMDAVFERVLAKSPDDRYQSSAEFVAALQEATGIAEVRYQAGAPTVAAATSPKRGAVDPDAPTQLRMGQATVTPPQRMSHAVPILASAVGVLAVAATVLGVYATHGRGGGTSTTVDPTTASSTASSLSTTSSLPPAHSPTVMTATAETAAPVPTQTRTVVPTMVAPPPAPYIGMPCTPNEFNQTSADGTLYCTVMGPQPHWEEKELPGPGYQAGTPCAQPGARAKAAYTEGNVTCKVGPDGNLVWSF